MKAKCPGAIPEIFIATVEGIEFEKEIHWSACNPSRFAVIQHHKNSHQFAKRQIWEADHRTLFSSLALSCT